MNLDHIVKCEIERSVSTLFSFHPKTLTIQPTNPDFEGSHTLICFPLAALCGKKPEEVARQIGDDLVGKSHLFVRYNVVKGFLNLVLADAVWLEEFRHLEKENTGGRMPSTGEEIIIEFSSPNTNKPLHLGHLRNNFLGSSVAALYEALGCTVHKVQIINDRGIHICKSMVAWKKRANGQTPEQSGLKGDQFVGHYYVEFDKLYKKEIADQMVQGVSKEQAEKEAPCMRETIHMLKQWEKKDPAVMELWKTMNNWVYRGFEATYKKMGVTFDKLYFESETYLLGKEEIQKGLEQGIFIKEQDGSVWVDLTNDGLDRKILLRSDGTSVYMTQDIGTAILRSRDFPKSSFQIYTVGSEQEYHFKVLFLILKKLGYRWAENCYHLSYGMVDLPSGKMKSREGTVVDADDLMASMVEKAKKQTLELGKMKALDEAHLQPLFETIGIGALKYHLLKVDPRKRILFDPNESIQLQGHTGPFIQYTYARIQSILRKATERGKYDAEITYQVDELLPIERNLIYLLTRYSFRLREAAAEYSPAVMANYVYELTKEYNHFYQSVPILGEENGDKTKFRIALSAKTAETIKNTMHLLRIEVPDRM